MRTPRSLQPSGGEQRRFARSSFADVYEEALVGPLFAPWVEPLLADVELRPGERVLDLACGTGIVARLAKLRLGASGKVVGIDLNPQMLAVARRADSSIDWREGDAGALPLREGEQFDVVLCQQGFQFFRDPAAAARQAHRALAKGGRIGASTWRPDEESALLHQLRRVAERHLGPIVDGRHRMGEAGPLEDLLREAGFRDVRSKRVSRTVRFDDAALFVRLNAVALIGMVPASKSFSDEERDRIVAAIERDSAELVRVYTDEAGVAYDLGANFVLATA